MYNKESYVYNYNNCPLEGSVKSQWITSNGKNIFDLIEDSDILSVDWILENVPSGTFEALSEIVDKNSVTYHLEEINGKKYLTLIELPLELIRYIEKDRRQMNFNEIIEDRVSDFVEFILMRDVILKRLRTSVINKIKANGYYASSDFMDDIPKAVPTDAVAELLRQCPLTAKHLRESLWDIMSDYNRIRDNYLNIDFFYSHDYKFNSIQDFYMQFNMIPEYMQNFIG